MGILIGFVGMMRRRVLGGFESGRCAVCQMNRLD
jgi:hypothetical protein